MIGLAFAMATAKYFDCYFAGFFNFYPEHRDQYALQQIFLPSIINEFMNLVSPNAAEFWIVSTSRL